MKLRQKQSGFAGLELILVVAVLAVVGYAVYVVHSGGQVTLTQPFGQRASGVPAAPGVHNAADLTKAQTTLDKTNIDENNSDSAQLDADSAGF